MIIKKSIIFGVLALGILGACAEKNKKEEQKKEVIKTESTEFTVEVKQTISEEEKKVRDSIKQVKEHGHVH